MHMTAEKKTDKRREAQLALVKEGEQLLTEIRSQQHRLKFLKASSGHGSETSLEEGSTDEGEGRAEEGDDDTRVERESILRHIVASQKLLKHVRTKMYEPEIRRASQGPFYDSFCCALDAAAPSSSSSSPSPNKNVVMKPTQGPEEREVEGDRQRGKGGRRMVIDEGDGVFWRRQGETGDEEEDAERLLGGGLIMGCGEVASSGNVGREVLKGVQGGAVGGKGATEESASGGAVERSKDAGAEVVTKVLFRHSANAHDCYQVRKHSAAIAYVPAHSGGGEGWIVAGGGLVQGARVSGGWAGGGQEDAGRI
jgi:hypothetical protein